MLSRIITFYHPHGHPKVGAISNLPTAEEETEAHRGDVTFPHKDTWQKVSAQELDLNGLVFRLPKADRSAFVLDGEQSLAEKSASFHVYESPPIAMSLVTAARQHGSG